MKLIKTSPLPPILVKYYDSPGWLLSIIKLDGIGGGGRHGGRRGCEMFLPLCVFLAFQYKVTFCHVTYTTKIFRNTQGKDQLASVSS